jgi:phosphopantetheine adenylyltransferase
MITIHRSNKEILNHAFKYKNCLVIDCANIMDPHRLGLTQEELFHIYVLEVEMLYKFRDVLKNLNNYIKDCNASLVAITRINHLMNYQNEEENKQVYIQCLELIKQASKDNHIIMSDDLFKKCSQVRPVQQI